MSTWQARHRRRLATLKARRPGPFDVLSPAMLEIGIDRYIANLLARYRGGYQQVTRIFHGGL